MIDEFENDTFTSLTLEPTLIEEEFEDKKIEMTYIELSPKKSFCERVLLSSSDGLLQDEQDERPDVSEDSIGSHHQSPGRSPSPHAADADLYPSHHVLPPDRPEHSSTLPEFSYIDDSMDDYDDVIGMDIPCYQGLWFARQGGNPHDREMLCHQYQDTLVNLVHSMRRSDETRSEVMRQRDMFSELYGQYEYDDHLLCSSSESCWDYRESRHALMKVLLDKME